ncbi:TetR-like C-terminal domain-containing protein [Nocardia sp. NPDC004568]|uniref:TetR-like C-terminal domain-containing protein n=1 Tax=Nocardia sp. NPDC004568 TaxID=3154551 RepID=UPI0033B1DF11
MRICRAVREWALAHPAEFGLLYGNPVPGYAAPQETVEPAARVVLLLVDTVIDGSEHLEPITEPVPAAVRGDLRRLIDQHSRELPEERLIRVLAGWTQLLGLIGFEIFGRLDAVIEDRAAYFDHQMAAMADLAGLPR